MDHDDINPAEDNTSEPSPTHVKVPLGLMNEVVNVLMTLPAGQVFDILTALRSDTETLS